MNIIIFGTSITYGAWDSRGGWVGRLREFIDTKIIESNYEIDCLVYNLGISGNKSADILERFESEITPRLDQYDGENIILLDFGINDTIFSKKLETTEVSEEDFRVNTEEIIKLAKKYSSKIVAVGLTPVDKRVDPIPWSRGRGYSNEFITKYNDIFKEIAENEGIGFINILQEFLDSNYESMLVDGVHLNEQGHMKLFEEVKEYLLDEKIINF